jgi:16S rRNA (adenine1518-N6/adenine1519-N6)-dimethyltransferase
MVNRQTISYLRNRFDEVGLAPNSRHGQNFLIDLNLIKLLAESAEVGPDDVVLEIGTGMGSLTCLLAEKARKVITVEIDHHLLQLAREELESFDNITILHQDALRNKNNFDQRVIDTVQSELAKDERLNFKLAANLPYNVATPIISNLLISPIVPVSQTVTIQKELGDRILAKPNSKDYGALTVWIQSLCDSKLVRVLAPSVFWPRPKVHSSILHIESRPDKREKIPDLRFFHKFVRSMFFHRRKFLRSVAVAAFKNLLDKPQVDEVLTDMKLGSDARTEQLTVETMQEMCERFRQQLLKVQGSTDDFGS